MFNFHINIINGNVNTSWMAMLNSCLIATVHIINGNVNAGGITILSNCLIAILILFTGLLILVEPQC